MEAFAGLIDKVLATGRGEWVTQLSLHARVVLFLERCKNLDVNPCDFSVLGNGNLQVSTV